MKFKVLVFCHPRKFDHTHHLYDFIMSYAPEGAIIETVDVAGTPDYVADAFTPSFARKHKLEFDLMFLMDCGGDFMFSQPAYTRMYSEDDRYVMKMNFINKIVHFTSNMLKPGGSMFLAKIFDGVKEIYEKKFRQMRWEADTEFLAGMPYLKITRPRLLM